MIRQSESGSTVSVWADEADLSLSERLAGDLSCDVCIVGAGIAGLSVAYHLAREGSSVVVLDDGGIGSGETGRTTAHLSNAIDDRYYEIERFHGTEGARLAAESHTSAIDRIESIVKTENIACDFVRLDGYLFQPAGGDAELIARELECAQRAGLAGVSRLDRAPVESFDTGPCLRFPRQGQFHVLKYLAGLARAVRRDRGRIFDNAHVVSVEGGKDAAVKTESGHTIRAAQVVVATNTPINDRFAIHTKQSAYRSYAIAAPVPLGSVPAGLYWDGYWESDDPYHYVRLQHPNRDEAGSDYLIVGGEDHKTGQASDPEERYARLESWTRERFPMIGEVAFRWSGQIMETVDGVAFIGRNPADADNVFIVTGDSGLGMTHGTIAGMLISDLIMGRPNAWEKLYDPARRTLRAGSEFAKENLNVARQYADWVSPGEVQSADEIPLGEGAIIRRGLTKLAVHRDANGELIERSAVCPHLGCIVHWNSGEKTWDCPCHGSRFSPAGEVLNGPAVTPLGPID